MSRNLIESYYPSRKRPANEDLISSKNKVLLLEDSNPDAFEKTTKSVILDTEQELARTPDNGSTYKQVKLLTNKKESLIFDLKDDSTRKGSPKSRSKAVAKLCFEGDSQEVTNEKPISKKVPPKKSTASLVSKKNPPASCTPITAFMTKLNNINTLNGLKDNAALKDKPSDKQKPYESVVTARRELSLGAPKRASSTVAQSRVEVNGLLSRLQRGFDKLNAIAEKKKEPIGLKEFKSIDIAVPVSPSKKLLSKPACERSEQQAKDALLLSPRKELFLSPRKVAVSPVKSPTKEPAYLRHAAIASSSGLQLPYSYRFLAEAFRGIEFVSSMLSGRKETITFSKLQPSVQKMLKRNITEKHLAQIKQLASDMYTFERQKVKSFSFAAKQDLFELILQPVLGDEEKAMTPTVMSKRQSVFYNRLLDVVKNHHAKFLEKLDPPIVIPKEKITRWHPEFDLEGLPEVEKADLPEQPQVETFSSAKDVLNKACEMYKFNPRLQQALQKLTQGGLSSSGVIPSTTVETKAAAQQTEACKPALGCGITNPELLKLPKSLLDKVKAKQAAKQLLAMTRSPEEDKKALVYGRLPDLARTLRSVFVTEKKNVLPLKQVLSKLETSFKSRVSVVELEKDLKVLAESVPGWLVFHDVRNMQYLKLARDAELSKIVERLDKLAKQHNAPL